MPTGYTQPLYDGSDITFEEWVMRCARGMGAAITQRDEPLDAPVRLIEVGDHYLSAVEDAQAQLTEALGRSDEQWLSLQEQEIAKAEKHQADYLAYRAGIRDRYRAMRVQVQEWVPPTDAHVNLKEFMLDQLRSSEEFDCGRPGGPDYVPSVPELVPVAEYKAREIARLAKRSADRAQELAKEVERVRGQNEWVLALRASLGLTTELAEGGQP